MKDIARAQARTVKRNRLVDAICGPIAPGVPLQDTSFAGPGGDLPVRVYRPTRRGANFTADDLELSRWSMNVGQP